MFSKTVGTPSTEMRGQAIPRIPSKRATKKVIPGSFVASANPCLETFKRFDEKRKRQPICFIGYREATKGNIISTDDADQRSSSVLDGKSGSIRDIPVSHNMLVTSNKQTTKYSHVELFL